MCVQHSREKNYIGKSIFITSCIHTVINIGSLRGLQYYKYQIEKHPWNYSTIFSACHLFNICLEKCHQISKI